MDSERNLENAVLAWWRGFRPLAWSVDMHEDSPCVNLTREREGRLAALAAAISRKRRMK